MNITKGDYARFNSNTYLEVYEDIQARSLKQYREEAAAHEKTKQQLFALEKKSEEEKAESGRVIEELSNRVASLELQARQQEEKAFEKRVNKWGWVATIICIGIPYFLLTVLLELFKSQLSTLSWHSALGYGIAALLTILIAAFFKKGRRAVFTIVRKKLSEKK